MPVEPSPPDEFARHRRAGRQRQFDLFCLADGIEAGDVESVAPVKGAGGQRRARQACQYRLGHADDIRHRVGESRKIETTHIASPGVAGPGYCWIAHRFLLA
jgi:hypothetical protein